MDCDRRSVCERSIHRRDSLTLLTCSEATFCQFFLSRDTKKLIDNMTLATIWSSVMSMWPTATPRHRTFLSWNLMVLLTSTTLLFRSSLCEIGVGNLPALERPGPSRRGICLMRASDATKASYFYEHLISLGRGEKWS